jgi:hypothetical protein
MNVYYPSIKCIKGVSPVVYEYLLNGFQNQADVIIDERLDKESIIHVEPGKAIHIFKFLIEINGKKHKIIYDFSDFHYYYPEIREEGDFYFKIHFLKEYYDNPRMFPIGQTVGKMDYVYNLKSLRDKVDEKVYNKDLIAIYRTTNYDIRLKAVELLKNSGLNVKTGLKDFNAGKVRPYAPDEHKIVNLDPYLQHMSDLTRCKYVLALPAVDNSRAWKHVESMGMGIPLLALDLKSILPSNYDNCYIKIKDDLSDLIEKIHYYNIHEKERLEIGENGKKYFDKYLSPTGMANNIIERITNDQR